MHGVCRTLGCLVGGVLLAGSCVAQETSFVDYVPLASSNSSTTSMAAPAMLVSANPVNSRANSDSFWPRPYTYAGLALSSGAGYSPAAGVVGSGLNIDTRHFLFLAEGSLQNARKLDSGTGMEYDLKARSFARAENGWFFGGGAQWSKLSTAAYAKQAWRPTFGGGKDVTRESFSFRAQALYVLPGTDHLNAVQGPEISLWLPSPAAKAHFFYRQTIGIYEFHQTSVPGNSGTNIRNESTFVSLTAMYRF